LPIGLMEFLFSRLTGVKYFFQLIVFPN